jgi:hypothetical protein
MENREIIKNNAVKKLNRVIFVSERSRNNVLLMFKSKFKNWFFRITKLMSDQIYIKNQEFSQIAFRIKVNSQKLWIKCILWKKMSLNKKVLQLFNQRKAFTQISQSMKVPKDITFEIIKTFYLFPYHFEIPYVPFRFNINQDIFASVEISYSFIFLLFTYDQMLDCSDYHKFYQIMQITLIHCFLFQPTHLCCYLFSTPVLHLESYIYYS